MGNDGAAGVAGAVLLVGFGIAGGEANVVAAGDGKGRGAGASDAVTFLSGFFVLSKISSKNSWRSWRSCRPGIIGNDGGSSASSILNKTL